VTKNNKAPLKDLIVILPGITGSVLQKNGKDIWGTSWQAISTIALSGGNVLQELKLEGSDSGGLEYGDGIKATRLVSDAQIIPGLVKILDGYSATSKLITDNFEIVNSRFSDKSKVIPGDIYDDPETVAANFYHFPYDWRRDNKINAQIFNKLVNKRLKVWREFSGNKNAKVILLAHSMGGLISRYHLEVLGGWQDCRALFTFGTPYRGSVNAVNFLAHGLKKAVFDLTEVMRSLPSVYQLLPIYSILHVGNENKLIADVANLPNISQVEAKKALDFHNEIESAVESNRQESRYREQFATVPFVGVQQPTFQSAEFKDGVITVSRDLPRIMQGQNLDFLADGDSTVPRISAFPFEFSNNDINKVVSFIAEKHGALQSQKDILLSLLSKLQFSEAFDDIKHIRGEENEKARAIKSITKGISLDTQDLYFKDEAIVIKAQVNPDNSDFGGLNATIECLSSSQKTLNLDFEIDGTELRLNPEELKLEPGLYRIQVQADNTVENPLNAVHDLFEVTALD